MSWANRVNLVANLKAIFALPKWLKIFLGVVSIIALGGIIATCALNNATKSQTFSANLILKSQKSIESSDKFAYYFWIDVPKFKPLLRSTSIANVEIAQLAWDSKIDTNAIENLNINGIRIWLESRQDFGAVEAKSLGAVEYKVDFNPLLKNIIKIFVFILTFTPVLINIIKYRFVPFGRGDYLLAMILATISLVLCAGQVDSGHNWGGDFSGYIAQGIAIAQGTTAQYISDNTLMMTKCDWLYGPYAYPWGFPMLLAIVYKVFGFDIIAFKSVGIVCYALFVWIFYIFCAKQMPRIYAFFGTLLFAINPTMIGFVTNNVLSDTPFLLFGFVALIILAKLFCESVDCHESLCDSRNDDNIATKSHGIFIAIFGGIFMLFASLIRMNGFVILCALIAMHGIILAKRFAPQIFKIRALQFLKHIDSPYTWQIHTIPYAIFALGFTIVSLTLSSGGGGHFGMLANVNGSLILQNMDYYVEIFKNFFSNNGNLTLVLLCVPLIYLGFKDSINGTKFIENIFYMIFVVGFLALLCLWAGRQGIRFVYLVLPFAVFWGAKGLLYLNAKKALFGRIMSVLLFVVVVSFTLGVKNISFMQRDSTSGAYTKEAREMWDFIKQNTPKDSVILFHKPRVLYLNTHRTSFSSNNLARFDEVDFVLWEIDLWSGYDAPSIYSREFKERVNLIFQNAQFRLFGVKK